MHFTKCLNSITYFVLLVALVRIPVIANEKQNEPINGFELNLAQSLIYERNHLEMLDIGDKLFYKAVFRDKKDEIILEDDVSLLVTAASDGPLRSIDMEFLSGDNLLPFADFPASRGNPVFMAVLTRDVIKMRTATSGSDSYFRNRLRYSFAENPPVDVHTIRFNENEYSASTFTLTPYVNDKLIDRFPQFENKEYQFTICEELPGGIYSISIRNPGGERETYSLVEWEKGQ